MMWDWHWKKIHNKRQGGKKKKTLNECGELGGKWEEPLVFVSAFPRRAAAGQRCRGHWVRAEPRSPWSKSWDWEAAEGICGRQNIQPSQAGGNALWFLGNTRLSPVLEAACAWLTFRILYLAWTGKCKSLTRLQAFMYLSLFRYLCRIGWTPSFWGFFPTLKILWLHKV